MKRHSILSICLLCAAGWLSLTGGGADAQSPPAPCMESFLTGTGGPAPQNGRAQAGVFVRYGNSTNGCDAVRLQIDAGRGTLLRLSLIPAPAVPGFVTPQSLDALFLTHAHIDHTSSLPDILESRWIAVKNDGQFKDAPPPPGTYRALPVICSGRAYDIARHALTPWADWEIPQRRADDRRRAGPEADIHSFSAGTTARLVWQRGDVRVFAVAVRHIADAVGYRIDTPAGSLCVSGDTALAASLVGMCERAKAVIHDVIHPVIADIVAKPPPADAAFIGIIGKIVRSHALSGDLAAFNKTRAALILTHIIPPPGAGGFQGIPLEGRLDRLYRGRPPGPVSMADHCRAVRDGRFSGPLYVGVDLLKIKIVDGTLTVTPPKGMKTVCPGGAF